MKEREDKGREKAEKGKEENTEREETGGGSFVAGREEKG